MDKPKTSWQQARSSEITAEEISARLPQQYHHLVKMQEKDVANFNAAQSELGKLLVQVRSRMYRLRRQMTSRRVRMNLIKRDIKREIIRERYAEIQKQIGL